MSPSRSRRCAWLAGIVAAGLASHGAAGEVGTPEAPRILRVQQGGPCQFFQGQAYHKGLTHFATEMLWACEAIARRGAVGQPLGARLAAAEAAMQRYREAVIAAGRTAFAETRTRDVAPKVHGISEQTKRRLAEETGALAALETIRGGF